MFMPLPTRLLTSIKYLHIIIKNYYMKISKFINFEAKEIAAWIKIDGRVECIAKYVWPTYEWMYGWI